MARPDKNEQTTSSDAASRSKKSRAARDAMAKGTGSVRPTAGKGGGSGGQSRDVGFSAAVAAIVVLGIGAVLFARSQLTAPGSTAPRLGVDHWHSAFGLYVCDSFLPPLSDTQGDARGIHSHDDGIMHIHPSSSLAAGEEAQIGDFLFEVGVDLTDDSMTLPNGDTFTNGDECGDQGPGEVKLARWSIEDIDAEPELITSDLNDARYLTDREAWTLAFIPDGEDIPIPPTVDGVDQVTDVVPAPHDGGDPDDPDGDSTDENQDDSGGDGTEGDENGGDEEVDESDGSDESDSTEDSGG